MTSNEEADIESALLGALRHFFEERAKSAVDPADSVGDRKLQLATTVLFLQMIAADHDARHDEHDTLELAISQMLGITGEDVLRLIRLAEEHVKTPLPKLLRFLDLRCTIAQKKKVAEGMWRLAFADAELAGHEEYFVRKVSQALGLNTADLVEAKVLAKEAFLAQP